MYLNYKKKNNYKIKMRVDNFWGFESQNNKFKQFS